MTDRPILFSAPMVRSILEGRKVQTRRALKAQPLDVLPMKGDKAGVEWVGHMQNDPPGGIVFRCKFGKPGDRLWVRETWGRDNQDGTISYRADIGSGGDADDFERNRFEGAPNYRWRPSIHMPRAASRILLEVVSVRVERLQKISRGDAMAEGCPFPNMAQGDDPRQWYAQLWEQIYGVGSWAANPWVWVIDFRRVA